MRGFLDPAYPTHVSTDYRAVIDGLVVGLAPQRAYGFGHTVSAIPSTLGTLGRKDFYSDNDTRMEEPLDSIGRDTAFGRTYVIVGDGRRGSPNVANGQFVRMREVASRWTGHGGTFFVASSLAPFKTVSTDPSGCRSSPASTCPLYAFAFAAPGDESRIAIALSRVFEHLYAFPLPSLSPGDLTVAPTGPLGDLRLETRWAKAADGTRIVRVGAQSPSKSLVRALLSPADTLTPIGRVRAAALRGTQSKLILTARSLSLDAVRQPWTPIDPHSALVRPAGNDTSLAIDLYSRGQQSPAYVYRIDLASEGAPSWLDYFDAADASEGVRTFGLGRLFEAFKQQAATTPSSVGRIYLVMN